MKFLNVFLIKLSNKTKTIYTRIFYGLPYGTYKACLTNRSFDSMSFILYWIFKKVKNVYPDLSLEGARILEIGSGQVFCHPIAFNLLGAKKITTIDIKKQFNNKAAYLSLKNNVMARKIFSDLNLNIDIYQLLKNLSKQIKSSKELNLPFIKYLAPFDITTNKIKDEFDIIFSYTVLEHIFKKDIKVFLKSTIDVLIAGGYLVHYIDLEDHLSPSRPFSFLDIDNWDEKNAIHRGNRLRYREWESIIKSLNLSSYYLIPINFRDSTKVLKINSDYFCGILFIGKK